VLIRSWRIRALIFSLIVALLLPVATDGGAYHGDMPLETARSVILFIGDGMGEAQRRAARWASVGQGGILAMDDMPVSGWSRTASANRAITDSAAGGTALSTGVKAYNGMIAMDFAHNPLTTILERAQTHDKAVGLVTNVHISHATPACFAAHVPFRGMMTEIARQILAARVNVLLGGGEDEFLPPSVTGCYPGSGERTDGRNLISEAVADGYTYVCDAASFEAVDTATTSRLLGLFADEGMKRPFSPSLAEMTQAAIDILSQDADGFFLMVEGGQIDWACHANDAANAITDTIDFDDAVSLGIAYAATAGDALIIVTADHETGGMSVDLTPSGLPDEDGPFTMPDGTPFYVNWTTDYHSAADVPVTVQGPRAELLSGTYENTHVHDAMYVAVAFDRMWADAFWLLLPLASKR